MAAWYPARHRERTDQVSESTNALTLPATAAAQLAYHVRMAAVFAAAGDTAESVSEALALELEAHFVSVGLHTEAALYETVAEHLDETIATLVNDT